MEKVEGVYKKNSNLEQVGSCWTAAGFEWRAHTTVLGWEGVDKKSADLEQAGGWF